MFVCFGIALFWFRNVWHSQRTPKIASRSFASVTKNVILRPSIWLNDMWTKLSQMSRGQVLPSPPSHLSVCVTSRSDTRRRRKFLNKLKTKSDFECRARMHAKSTFCLRCHQLERPPILFFNYRLQSYFTYAFSFRLHLVSFVFMTFPRSDVSCESLKIVLFACTTLIKSNHSSARRRWRRRVIQVPFTFGDRFCRFTTAHCCWCPKPFDNRAK